MGCQTLLWESSDSPSRFHKLVGGWLDYIGVCDASSHGVGGVIFGKNEACMPTILRWWEWPQDVKESYNAKVIVNSNLEMAGLLFPCLVMELVCRAL